MSVKKRKGENMRKYIVRRTSLLLVALMIVSVMLPFSSVFAAEEVITDGRNPDLEFTVLSITPSPAPGGVPSLLTGAVKMLASRAWQELAAYSITNDVPGLSTFFKLLQTPAQRAAAAQRQMITQVVTDIAEIKASVGRIEVQLNDVADKLDKYETASAFSIAANKFRDIADKYKAPWAAYETVIKATETLVDAQEALKDAESQLEKLGEKKTGLEKEQADLEAAISAETDETRLVELNDKLAAVKADIQTVVTSIETGNATKTSLEQTVKDINDNIDNLTLIFVNVCEEGGGMTFASDLSSITSTIWNTQNPTGSYLGAYEAFLRERYALEHEITDALREAYEMCVDTMTQMLTIYTEYYTCKKNDDPENTIYKAYSEAYFDAIQKKIINNFDIIAKASGFDKLMITEDYTAEELAEFRKNDPGFVAPENINQSVVIDGVTYKCYKVRDNKDKLYYIIPKGNISNRTLVSRTAPDYATTGGMIIMDYYDSFVYRPTMILDNEYTDDGRYRMVSAAAVPDFITDAGVIRTSLRSVSKLTEIPEDAAYLMLYHNECVNMEEYYFHDDVYWNMRMLKLDGAGNVTPEKVSSESVYNDSKYEKSLVIYREVNTDHLYGSDKEWKVIDRGEISNRTITVNDGQTLDLTGITVNPDNVNIHIIGGGKIVSNPNITLTNSHMVISSDSAVEIEGLNMTGRNYDKAVVEIVRKNNEFIRFEGTNTFTASSEKLMGLDIYEQYEEGMPLAASSGMYIAEGADCTIFFRNATFKGAAGGAGICSDARVYFRGEGEGDNLIATGSSLTNYEDRLENYYIPRAVGAGIGVSFSGVDYVHDGIDLQYSHGYLGTKGTYIFDNVNVNATGADGGSDHELYADDIGCVYTAGGDFHIADGKIEYSTVKTKNLHIASEINTTAYTNAYFPDLYTITAYTKGSNGETTDGVYFNIIGAVGETGWIYASEIGNDKGQTTQTLKANSVGSIKAIKVKTKDSNHWYPGKITVSAKYMHYSATVYGGRWIGNTEKTLSPDDNVYEVTIRTGSDSNSGTDANIFLFLQDDNGTVTDTIEVSDIHQDADAFEKGDTDTFPIYAPEDFGECCHAFLESDHSGSGPGWKVDAIEVRKVQGKTSDSGYTVNTGFWYEYAKRVNFGKYSGKTGAYYIEVKTGGESGAGTDSTIYLTLHGDKYSKDTEEINMSGMAGDGDDFEKNDNDCFYIGYDKNGIGDIKSITVRKDDGGSGPGWYLESIKITEEIASGQTAKVYTFDINSWIYTSSYTFNVESSSSMVQSSAFDRDILKGLKANEDGSYTLTVDRNINLTEEVFALLQETGKVLEVIMTDEGKPIYSLTFDGRKITDYHSLSLNKGYSFADGNAMLDFINGANLPAGTTVKLYTENIGFLNGDKLVVFNKGDDGQWDEHITVEGSDGVIEFTIEEGRDLLINRFGTDLPTGEAEEDPQDNPPTGDSITVYAVMFMFIVMTAVVVRRRKSAVK